MLKDLPSTVLPLKEAAQRFGLSYHQLYRLVQRGRVRGARAPGGAALVDVASLEERFPPPGWAWLPDALKRYSLSREQVDHPVSKGALRARKFRGR